MRSPITTRNRLLSLSLLIVLSLLVACTAQPTPQVVKETVQVEKVVEKPVVQTQVVEKVVTPTALPPKKGTVTIGVADVNGPLHELARQRLTAAYNELNPGVTIKWVGPPEGGDYTTWLSTQLAVKPIEVDIVSPNFVLADAYADMDQYLDMTNPYTGRSLREDWNFEPGRPMTPWTPKFILLATRSSKNLFIYNKDIFAQAKVEPPKTWAELIDVCAKIKALGVTPLGIRWEILQEHVFIPYIDQLWRNERYEFARVQPGDWKYDPEKDGKVKYDPNDPNGLTAYNWTFQRWLKNFKDGKWQINDPRMVLFIRNFSQLVPECVNEDMYVIQDEYPLFLQQQAAMMVASLGTVGVLQNDMKVLDDARRKQLNLGQDSKIKPFEVGAFTHPPFEDKLVEGKIRGIESVGGEYLGLVQKDQAQMNLAYDFLQFWLSPKGYQAWLDGLYLKGYVPPGPTLGKYVTDLPQYQTVFESVPVQGSAYHGPYGAFFTPGPWLGKEMMAVQQNLKDAFDKKITPEEAAARWQKIWVDNWQSFIASRGQCDASIEHPERQPDCKK